jgi:hypothetical protein
MCKAELLTLTDKANVQVIKRIVCFVIPFNVSQYPIVIQFSLICVAVLHVMVLGKYDLGCL